MTTLSNLLFDKLQKFQGNTLGYTELKTIEGNTDIEIPDFLPGQSVSLQPEQTHITTQVGISAETQSDLLNNDQSATINVTYNGFTPEAQAAFEYAVDIWETWLISDVPIEITAAWVPLDISILASAGPSDFMLNFQNAPAANTWYPMALANRIAEIDLAPDTEDVITQFNSNVSNWYFGTDAQTPEDQYDFVSVVLHELGHGLGLSSLMEYDESAKTGTWGFAGLPSIYTRYVANGAGQSILNFENGSVNLGEQLTGENLFFTGRNAIDANNGLAPKLFAPSPWILGSSYTHLDEEAYGAGDVNSLMTPFIGLGEAIHEPGAIVFGMLADMGWTVTNSDTVPIPELIDLTGTGTDGDITLNFTLSREAAFDNLLQFYITDANGAIAGINPGEAGYEDAVRDNLLEMPQLFVENLTTKETIITLEGGFYYAPVLVIDGNVHNLATIDDAALGSSKIKREGDVWSFEDLLFNSDDDFNDLVLTFNAMEPATV
ncbi:MAG: hypothetical protein AAGD09_24110 [Cyanobacteria bacterium P01_F01_bin.56]